MKVWYKSLLKNMTLRACRKNVEVCSGSIKLDLFKIVDFGKTKTVFYAFVIILD